MQDSYRPSAQGSTAPAYDSSSVSSTASVQNQLPPTASLLNSGPPSRPGSGIQHVLPPGNNLMSTYGRTYESPSMSPSDHATSYSDASLPNGLMPSPQGLAPSQVTSAALQNQKRAYRQRRKDPSCDACRERKVKVQNESLQRKRNADVEHSATLQTHRAVQNAPAEM